MTLSATVFSLYVYKLQGLLFKKIRLRRFKKEGSYILIMSLNAILMYLQGLFFKNFGLRRFKNEVSYTLRMTLSAIFLCLQVISGLASPQGRTSQDLMPRPDAMTSDLISPPPNY